MPPQQWSINLDMAPKWTICLPGEHASRITAIGFFDAKTLYTLWRPVMPFHMAQLSTTIPDEPDPGWLPSLRRRIPTLLPGAHSSQPAAGLRYSVILGDHGLMSFESLAAPRTFPGFSSGDAED